ncbi:DUF979 domain-containing protein [Geobacillus sp. FSL W8-0032]|uniref:Membrane protein n=1 Tax=Geobacillus subterraneus TaxID=129338 RepID=A0A679FWX7_9BACL|nr:MULTISPECIES: DUF979 domain-containing protein [Geobacillus]KYD30657.1 hypothetical protein B4113_4045 [Geobacillus sp. B4113_201601]BBW96221.1 membrane protein [Geobacillus subterraneus]
MWLSMEAVYIFLGIVVTLGSVWTFADRSNPKRLTSGLFYLLYGVTLLFGSVIPPFYTGVLVLIMVAIVGFGGLKLGKYEEASPEERQQHRQRLNNRLFIPALLIPILTVIGVTWLKNFKIGGAFLLDPNNFTLVSLGVATFMALLISMAMTRSTPFAAVKESRRLLETIGWAALLPQMLATLGTIFTTAGVGAAVSEWISTIIPTHSLFWIVVSYCVGMALFTMIMGNAFAAFPVMTAGIAVPLLIQQFGVDANHVAALGMFSGYCGTLMTPMAANFNIVPAALLDLRDQHHVIRVQVPTALILLAFNIVAMYVITLMD